MSAKWGTLMMASVMPKVRSRLTVISRRVRPLISTRALGRGWGRGRRRVPRPAARIMALIDGLSKRGFHVAKLDWAVSCWIVGSKRKAAQNICTEGTESKEHTQKREERIGQFG